MARTPVEGVRHGTPRSSMKSAAEQAPSGTLTSASPSSREPGSAMRAEVTVGSSGNWRHDLSQLPVHARAPLTVSDPTDGVEWEAERLADAVLRAPASLGGTSPVASPPIASAPSRSAAEPSGAGRPLPGAVRSSFEPRFGHDLGQVRLHVGTEAAALADAFDARAYTVSQHIVLGAGVETPGTAAGNRLLAHELAHTIQAPAHRATVRRLPKNPEGTPFPAEVFPHWSTPLHNRPSQEATSRIVDLPRYHVVTVESGRAWLRVSAVVDGTTLTGFISHEQLRRVSAPEPEDGAEKDPATVEPDPALPPLHGVIAEPAAYFVRAAPGGSGAKLGKLSLQTMHVTVLKAEEVKAEGPPSKDLWYHVRFTPKDFETVVMTYSLELMNLQLANDPGVAAEIALHDAALRAHHGTEAWIGQAALPTIAMPWDHFLLLLDGFEKAHAGQALLERLSRLRQMGEESDVPGNQTVGAGADLENQVNRDQITPDPNRWQLLFESKQVELPGGEIVDIHHFLLGVESLIDDGRRSENRTITYYGIPVTKIGQSYAAATWSGDVGAAAADFIHHKSRVWEEASVLGRSEAELLNFYFRTRAPDFDLLADIDAWGAYELVPHGEPEQRSSVTSLVALVTAYYGPAAQTPALHEFVLRNNRAHGIRNLLTHYGFTSATGLRSQTDAARRIEDQVLIFSTAWYQVKSDLPIENVQGPSPRTQEDLADASRKMTEIFLDWLEKQARSYAVTLDGDLPEGSPR